jgi:hypothetical protein
VKVSVFTPSHDTRFLGAGYASLVRQSHADWEWVVLLNGKARHWEPPAPDERVRVQRAPSSLRGVGALKRAACELATGDILVELDHDDELASGCLAEVVSGFAANPDTVLAYSDFAQINADSSSNYDRFDESMGWRYSEEEVDGVRRLRCHSMAPTPHNVAHIWFAPNHVRAFRRTAYEKVGGYNPDLRILDDQDLMLRLFLLGDFVHLPSCLYLQRMHRNNTQRDPRTNAKIQEQSLALYRESIEPLALRWCARRGLAALRLSTPTSVGTPAPVEDLEEVMLDVERPALRYNESEVGLIVAVDVLQRVAERARFLNECHRVLSHGGLLLTQTPSTDGRGAFQDPSHVAFYNENSFMYVVQKDLRPTIPTLLGRFQLSHLRTYFPSEIHEQMSIPYVQANLLAIKDGPRQGGALLC